MKHTNDKRTAPPATACWQREAPCACLRIELGCETHLFPYQHFVSGTHALGEDEGETLHLAFSSHDVEITGRNLRGLLSALQDFAVKWMRAIPQRYQTLEPTNDGMISRIRVEEVK